MARTPKHPARPPARSGLSAEIGKRRPFEQPEVEAFLNIVRTASILESEVGRFFKPFKLSAPQYNALRILRGHLSDAKHGVPSQTIGEELVAQVPDVTRLVDRLVEAGLAERSRTESDRRMVLVRITKAGHDLLARIDTPLADLHTQQLGHLSKADLAAINRLMVRARTRSGSGGSAEDNVRKRCPE